MLFILTTFLAVLALVPGGQVNAIVVRNRNPADNCLANCRSNFGWPGHQFPNDPWGLVMDPKLMSSSSSTSSSSSAAAIPTSLLSPVGAAGVESAPSSHSPILACAVFVLNTTVILTYMHFIVRLLRTSQLRPQVPHWHRIRRRRPQALPQPPTHRQMRAQSSMSLSQPPSQRPHLLLPRLHPKPQPRPRLPPRHLPRHLRPPPLLATLTKGLDPRADLRPNPIFKHISPDTTMYELNTVQPHLRTLKIWLQRHNNGPTVAYSSTVVEHWVPLGKTSRPGRVIAMVYLRLSSLGLMKFVRVLSRFHAIHLTQLNSTIQLCQSRTISLHSGCLEGYNPGWMCSPGLRRDIPWYPWGA